jgi:hypothetical protein
VRQQNICDCIRSTLVVATSIYGNLSVMSQSSDFWESMVLATLMQSKYADTPVIRWHIRTCAIACGLYWEFHNIQYWRRRLGCQKDNIPCISHTPILEGKFLSKKWGLYTRKYGASQHSTYPKALHFWAKRFPLCVDWFQTVPSLQKIDSHKWNILSQLPYHHQHLLL